MTEARDRYEAQTQPAAKLNEVPQEVRGRYRMVFGGSNGVHVLAGMLVELGLFGKLSGSEQDTARHNYAIELLACLGVLKPDETGHLAVKDMQRIVTALLGTAE